MRHDTDDVGSGPEDALESLFSQITATDAFALAVGVALLAFGRKLYWLALGAVGFFGGIWIAGQIPELESTALGLGASFLLGVAGACLAVFAQRMAIGLGGFFIGGALAYWTAAWLAVPLSWQPGPWLWLAAIAGAVLGTLVAALLFETSLVLLTSMFGALLVAKSCHVGRPYESWLFLILFFVGVIAQSGRGRRRRERED